MRASAASVGSTPGGALARRAGGEAAPIESRTMLRSAACRRWRIIRTSRKGAASGSIQKEMESALLAPGLVPHRHQQVGAEQAVLAVARIVPEVEPDGED